MKVLLLISYILFSLGLNAQVIYTNQVPIKSSGPSIGFVDTKKGILFDRPFTQEKGNYNDNEPFQKNFFSISVGSTTPIIGVTYERLLTRSIGLEAGIGIFSAGVGAKIYPFKLEQGKVNLHVGISQYFFGFVFIGGEWKTYIPIGLDYISERNIRYSIDAGPVFPWYFLDPVYELFPGVNFRVGKAF